MNDKVDIKRLTDEEFVTELRKRVNEVNSMLQEQTRRKIIIELEAYSYAIKVIRIIKNL